MSVDTGLDVRLSGALGGFGLNVAFTAPASGVTALYGPSGSGKTTVLRAVAGLSRLSGRVAVGDEIWQDDATGRFLKPHRRAVGYVFQEASLFPHLSVRGNLGYGRRRAGERPSGADFDEVVDLLGIAPLVERATARLSGGERQRVAVGRALLTKPKILLMDEPLAALDRASKAEILPYLERLNRERNIPIVYVSHDVAEVARLADRVIAISAGRIGLQGGVEVFESFDVDLTGGRAEAGTVVTARVAGEDAAYQITRLDLAGQTVVIPFAGLAEGREVRLRIRARDVAIALKRPVGISIRNMLDATIVGLEADPDSAFADLHLDVGGVGLRAQLTREAVAELGLRDGMSVVALVKSVSFEPETFT
ncbi:molybdenum ABC transporter ATP-binding protein [Amorphus sp. 3PC139-8]|uniref:molybdenum ABC transporter ATP-binding protein n=1 Tax=Amorphus sp. 3PC139-8 TaxID=2735676 RepID=UPI00345D908F